MNKCEEILNSVIETKPFQENEKQAIIRIWLPIMEKCYAQAIEDAIYRLEECKGYAVEFNRNMDLAIHEIKSLLSRGSR